MKGAWRRLPLMGSTLVLSSKVSEEQSTDSLPVVENSASMSKISDIEQTNSVENQHEIEIVNDVSKSEFEDVSESEQNTSVLNEQAPLLDETKIQSKESSIETHIESFVNQTESSVIVVEPTTSLSEQQQTENENTDIEFAEKLNKTPKTMQQDISTENASSPNEMALNSPSIIISPTEKTTVDATSEEQIDSTPQSSEISYEKFESNDSAALTNAPINKAEVALSAEQDSTLSNQLLSSDDNDEAQQQLDLSISNTNEPSDKESNKICEKNYGMQLNENMPSECSEEKNIDQSIENIELTKAVRSDKIVEKSESANDNDNQNSAVDTVNTAESNILPETVDDANLSQCASELSTTDENNSVVEQISVVNEQRVESDIIELSNNDPEVSNAPVIEPVVQLTPQTLPIDESSSSQLNELPAEQEEILKVHDTIVTENVDESTASINEIFTNIDRSDANKEVHFENTSELNQPTAELSEDNQLNLVSESENKSEEYLPPTELATELISLREKPSSPQQHPTDQNLEEPNLSESNVFESSLPVKNQPQESATELQTTSDENISQPSNNSITIKSATVLTPATEDESSGIGEILEQQSTSEYQETQSVLRMDHIECEAKESESKETDENILPETIEANETNLSAKLDDLNAGDNEKLNESANKTIENVTNLSNSDIEVDKDHLSAVSVEIEKSKQIEKNYATESILTSSANEIDAEFTKNTSEVVEVEPKMAAPSETTETLCHSERESTSAIQADKSRIETINEPEINIPAYTPIASIEQNKSIDAIESNESKNVDDKVTVDANVIKDASTSEINENESKIIADVNIAPTNNIEQISTAPNEEAVAEITQEDQKSKTPDKFNDLTAMILRRKELAAKNSNDKNYRIWSHEQEDESSKYKTDFVQKSQETEPVIEELTNTMQKDDLASVSAPIIVANAKTVDISPKVEEKLLEQEQPVIGNKNEKTVDRKPTSVQRRRAKATPQPKEIPQRPQLRNRKRRISGEKVRLSSESEIDNFDAANEFLGSVDQSSDEEVGGKRIKMRSKVTLKNVRKSVEQKRNVKDTDWSSDDAGKPIAKKSTGALEKQSKSPISNVINDLKVKQEEQEEQQESIENSENVAAIKEGTSKESTQLKSLPTKIENIPSEALKNYNTSQEDSTAQDAKKEIDEQVDVEQHIPARRVGRPPRKTAKKPPPPKAKPSDKNENADEESVGKDTKSDKPNEPNEQKAAEKSSPVKSEPRRKKRSLLGLDVTENAILPSTADGETPVRQSRRIAQIKIKEEAERRKAEEIALKKLKEASEKKKKGTSTAAPSTPTQKSESEEENSESESKLVKKKKRKKENKERPWQTDSSDSSERDEEDHDDHEDVERLPPLRSDHEFSPESDIEDESQIVPMKRARTARKDTTEKKTEEKDIDSDEDVYACQKCGKNDHPEWILLCDKCDKGYHCSCLIPVLFLIPEGNWFCPPCQQEQLIDALEAKLVQYDAVARQKEIEEEQRQRALFVSINEANVLKESKRDRQRERAQRNARKSESTDYSSSSDDSDTDKSNNDNENHQTKSTSNRQRKRSESSSDSSSDNEPIYKLRKRRQANVSYRFNEYDELINRAIKSEMDEVAGAGNLGRGKDISTIIEADKEEKRIKKLEQEQKDIKDVPTEGKQDGEDSDVKPMKTKKNESDDSDSEPIRPKVLKRGKNTNKKKKKLNSLDVDSNYDSDSDDDFKTSSYSDDEEENYSGSSAESESSLEIYRKKGKKGVSTRRSLRERKKRYDADFIDDNSDDSDNIPLSKAKKKKVDSDFSDINESSDDEELEEDVDSDDLCDDDSTDGSDDRPWQKSRKSSKKSKPDESKPLQCRKKTKNDDERAFKGNGGKKKADETDNDEDEVLPKSRRTRGKKLPYLLEDDFDSSDDGIKPGVKRPDTPAEERAAFIQKQEEIKRMLAEKGTAEGATEKLRKPTPKDSLSTIPPQIIQTTKALDVDLKKSTLLNKTGSDNDSNAFDDDLPEDFDPDDMDEDAIAKMMEEEVFAQQQLKLAGETIRNRKLKDSVIDAQLKKDISPSKLTIETSATSVIMSPHIPPGLTSPLPYAGSLAIPDIPPSMYTTQIAGSNATIKITTTPKKRGRKLKDDVIPPIVDNVKAARSIQDQFAVSKESNITAMSAIQHTPILPHHKPNAPMNVPPSVLHHGAAMPPQLLQHSPSTIQHTSSVISHSSLIHQQQQQHQQRTMPPAMQQASVPSLLGISHNQEPIIPSTVLEVQNTRLLDPSELGKPPATLLDSPVKKRGRRKKFTPLRDSLVTSPPNVTVTPRPAVTSAIVTNNPQNDVSKPPSSILSERLAGVVNPGDKRGLSIATPPQLYSPITAAQPSVITRLARPPQRPPFSSGPPQSQRYYAPNHQIPPHSLPSTVAHARSTYHPPNVVVTSGHRVPQIGPPHTSSHLSHPMYMRGQPGIYAAYPNIQPPPMHRSLQSIEHGTNSPQDYTGPYQNLPFGSYYPPVTVAASTSSGLNATHLTSVERRAGVIGSFEPFDNKTLPSSSPHERMPNPSIYSHHHPSPGVSTITTVVRNPIADIDDERSVNHAPNNNNPSIIGPGSTSEFSGLVSYFSSQQDDLE